MLEYLIIFFQLSIYLFILGNIIISFSLLIDSVTLYTSLLLYLFAIIFFGNGFIIELGLFSQKLNKLWVEQGSANSPLGLYLDINFELKQTVIKPSEDWFRLHPDKNVDVRLLQQESNIYNNLIEQYDMSLEVIKNSNQEAGGKV